MQSDKDLITDGQGDQPGFQFAPFDPDQGLPGIIRPDFFYQSTPRELNPVRIAPLPPTEPAAYEIHKEGVRRAVADIRKGCLQKVVLTRRFSVPFEGGPLQLFNRLMPTFPGAFRYLWYHPEYGCWAGASPEALMTFDGSQALTVSLAGTFPAENGKEPEWTRKEREEQQMVTDYILKRYEDYGPAPEVSGPFSVKAGSLWHLRTDIGAELTAAAAKELVRKLHPTPAICGVPPEQARECIQRLENYDREFYCGYVGINDLEGSGTLQYFVNLRCAQLRDGKAYLYVGGGITADSDPEQEWEETRHKSRTMLSVLNSP